MELRIEETGGVAVVALPMEELDADNAAELKREMLPLLESRTRVVFDLSRLRFMDSSGLGVFLSCLRRLSAKGGDLKLCCVAPPVRAVIELVRMNRILELHGTREDAVRAFGQKSVPDSAAPPRPGR